ncbi:MAG: hypothetical protein AB1921_05335 [Thermodesulfobacteriota bacterium]
MIPAPTEKDLVFRLSPTQTAFVQSTAQVVILKGPMGEGKTWAAIAGIIAHAQRNGKPIRAAIIRDTHRNIELSTIPDLKKILAGLITFHKDNTFAVININPRIEIDLFGAADESAQSKFQGPGWAIVWIEEPAPVIERSNAGLGRDVFDQALARCVRQGSDIIPRLQITQNPADEDHWTEELAAGPEVLAVDPQTGAEVRMEVFNIPHGENRHAHPLMRAMNRAAFARDPGKFARYVEGRAAPVRRGKSVTAEYNPVIHFSPLELPVYPFCPGVRMYDAWHHPAVIVCQLVPPGQLVVHDVVWGDGCGMRELVSGTLLPLLGSPKYANENGAPKISEWRDIGDPSMTIPDQSTVTVTTAGTVEELLKTRFEQGPQRWQSRINPLKTALTRLLPNGRPAILLSKSAYVLHRALNGGWHWKTDNNKNPIGAVPVKDLASNIGDAFSYGVAAVFPNGSAAARDVKKYAAVVDRSRAMAETYGSGLSHPAAARKPNLAA